MSDPSKKRMKSIRTYYIRNLAPLENFIIIALVVIPIIIWVEKLAFDSETRSINHINLLLLAMLAYLLISLLLDLVVRRRKLRGIDLTPHGIIIDTRPIIFRPKIAEFFWKDIVKFEVKKNNRQTRPGELILVFKDNSYQSISLNRYDLPTTEEFSQIITDYIKYYNQ